jgi:hypothetical protein
MQVMLRLRLANDSLFLCLGKILVCLTKLSICACCLGTAGS